MPNLRYRFFERQARPRVSAQDLWQVLLNGLYQLYLVINITFSQRIRHITTMFCHFNLQSKAFYLIGKTHLIETERLGKPAVDQICCSSLQTHVLKVSKKPSGRVAGDLLQANALMQQYLCDTCCSSRVARLGRGGCHYSETQTGNCHDGRKHLLQ